MCNLLQQHLQLILSIKPLSVCVLDFTWGKRCGVHPSDAQPAPLWASNLVLVLEGTLRIVIVKSFLWIAIVYCYCTLFLYIVAVLVIMNLDWFCICYCTLLLYRLLWIVIVFVSLCISEMHTALFPLWASNLVSAGALCIVRVAPHHYSGKTFLHKTTFLNCPRLKCIETLLQVLCILFAYGSPPHTIFPGCP